MPECNWKEQTIFRFVLSNIISVFSKNRTFTSSKNPDTETYRVMREGAQRYGTREVSRLMCDTVSGKKLETMIN